LQQWWSRHCQGFSHWFLTLSHEQQQSTLLNACPDMPISIPNLNDISIIKPTDIILPELVLDSLLTSNGKLFILFLTRRFVNQDFGHSIDLKLLNKLLSEEKLPLFSNQKLSEFKISFIDILDTSEIIQGLPLNIDITSDIYKHVMYNINIGRFIPIEVWLGFKLRRLTLTNFIINIIDQYQDSPLLLLNPDQSTIIQNEERKDINEIL
jgi:hypothetical protein